MVASKIDDFLKHPHPHSVTREIFRYIFKQQPYIYRQGGVAWLTHRTRRRMQNDHQLLQA